MGGPRPRPTRPRPKEGPASNPLSSPEKSAPAAGSVTQKEA